LDVTCSGLTHSEAVARKIEEVARKASQNKDDMIFVRLSGRFPRGTFPELPADLLAEQYFHVAIDASGVRPDYDFEKYLHEPELMTSVEGEFVKTLTNRGTQAKDEREKRLIRAALYYGLDALTEGRICGRYEE
jgi:hypothetical protein